MSDIIYLTTFPVQFMAGTTFSLTLGFQGYPSSGFSSNIYLINSTAKLTISGTTNADNSSFDYLQTASGTSSYVAGNYSYSIIATSADDTVQVQTGFVKVTPNIITSTALDVRTHERITLDALNALIEGKATKDVLSYTLGGRTLSVMPVLDLLKLKGIYQQKVNQQERLARGQDNLIRTQFREPFDGNIQHF